MQSIAVTLQPDQIDLFIRDVRDFGSLMVDRIEISVWKDEGLANLNLAPHCECVPICYQDVTPGDFLLSLDDQPCGTTGTITLVDDGNEVLDGIEFVLDADVTGDLWAVIHCQYGRRMSRSDIEERTWWAMMDGRKGILAAAGPRRIGPSVIVGPVAI